MKNNFGLKELPPDVRDYSLRAVVDLDEDLPEEFIFETFGVKDQKQTDFCLAFSMATASELQEWVELSPEWIFAKGKELVGEYQSWGLHLRQGAEALTKKGSIPQSIAPMSVDTHDRDTLANWENWDKELDKQALYHSKKAYFWVSSYEEIKQAIWRFRHKHKAVVFGVVWDWPSHLKIIDTPKFAGFGHALCAKGWKKVGGKEYLVAQNSWGEVAGDKGNHYFSKEVIDANVPRYGAVMFIDLTPEEAKKYLEEGVKLTDNWLIKLWKAIKRFFKDLLWQPA